jgi:hypothetical protein
MNNLPSSAAIRQAQATNHAALKQAQEDAALYERIKAAPALVPVLLKEASALTAKLSEALAAEAKAERDRIFARFGDINVTCHFSSLHSKGLLNAQWVIRWTMDVQTGYAWSSGMKEFTASDFTTLGHSYPDAYRYLVEARPEKIPDIIMQLSPDNPAEAMAIYCASKRANRIIMPDRTRA